MALIASYNYKQLKTSVGSKLQLQLANSQGIIYFFKALIEMMYLQFNTVCILVMAYVWAIVNNKAAF